MKNAKIAGSTLYITRLDIIIFIAVRLPLKEANVRCNETGKTISKKYWNEETYKEAKKLLAQHKTLKIGYLLFSIICLAIIAGIFYTVRGDLNSSKSYQNSFIAKNKEEQSKLLNKLGQGDLLLISNTIYRIKSSDNQKVVLEKNNSILPEKINSFNPIDESLLSENKYEGSYTIKKEDFVANNILIDNSSNMIVQYLDK